MYLGVRAHANAAGVAVMESPLRMLWQEREAVKEKRCRFSTSIQKGNERQLRLR